MKTPGNQRYRILVVDDEPAVRQGIKMLLEHDGHAVQTVDSGEAALAMLEHNTFDLITTDYSMEGMKGNQLAAIIKKCRPGQPIIMVTAFAADFHPSGKPSGGVDCVLSKPFTLAELREAIAGVMSLKESQPATPDPSASLSDTPEVPPPSHPGKSSSGRMRA
jgi:CheY-like chemotaxis protein